MLADSLGFDGALMCLLQIGETLGKIADADLAKQLPVRGASQIRNFIAHDYLGVSMYAIIQAISKDLPDLKARIEKYLSE